MYDSGETGGQLWFTMPFIEGESLRDRLRREQQLPVEDALRIATEIARALDYAHWHGVVHRDIKPENILLTKDGDTLVADFGIARAPAGTAEASENQLTETGMALGTPAYMSPEQASGGQVPSRHAAGESAEALPDSKSSRRWPHIPAVTTAMVLGFLLGVGVLFGWLRSQHPPEVGTAPKRLAMLPFESMGDTNDRAFASGVSEEITIRLARVPGLQLIARSSALQYPQSGQTAPQFGQAVGVDYVLDGTVRSTVGGGGQKQLRITPELIKVSDGTHVWGEPYEGVMADVFRLQADVAERVAEALRGKLGGGDQRALRTGSTGNLEAFRLSILGRAEWNRRTSASLERAVDYFRQAIALDSGFARAWTGLADAYALYEFYGVRTLPRDTAYARAREAALRAMALDSTLAEPHASLNQILRYGYWDWAGSEREIRKAIALDPDYATAHQWLAEHHLAMGRLSQALAEARTAVQLDPLATPPQNTLGLTLWYAGQIDEAAAVFRSALERDPTPRQPAGNNLFFMYLLSGRTADALSFLEAQHDTSRFRRALVRAPTDPAARTVVLKGLREGKQDWFTLGGSRIARTYAFLGERESALAELERSVAGRDPWLEWIKVDPSCASLRGDPRFVALVRRMGLPS